MVAEFPHPLTLGFRAESPDRSRSGARFKLQAPGAP